MEIPKKKLKNGFEMPIYGLGTWQMGGRRERDLNNNDEEDIKAIQAAIQLGVTHIDTAELYAEGYSEILLGKAIKNYERSKLFLVSKALPDHFSRENLLNACKKSLERIGTSYLDLYLLHWYKEGVDLKETMQALDDLVAQGLIKNIGVCNFGVEHLKEAQSYSKNKIVCDQVHYSLEFREPERKGLLAYCQKNDVFLNAWRPVGKGKIIKDLPTVLQEMCEKYQKTPAQVAINWLTSQDHVVTISKTRNVEHLKENLGAVSFIMEEKDIETLRETYPNQKDISDSLPLG